MGGSIQGRGVSGWAVLVGEVKTALTKFNLIL